MDISLYTQSEQPRAAEKQLTRLARNGIVDCRVVSNDCSRGRWIHRSGIYIDGTMITFFSDEKK